MRVSARFLAHLGQPQHVDTLVFVCISCVFSTCIRRAIRTGGDGIHLYLRVFQLYLARPTACGNTHSDTMQIRVDTRIEGKQPQI